MNSDEPQALQVKMAFLFLSVFIFILIVLSRLFYLQILRGDTYKQISEQISIRSEEVRARRGLILDRNGKVLADNRPYFEIVVIPQDLHDKEKSLDFLARLIPLTRTEMDARLKKAAGQPSFMPVVLREDAPYDWVARIREYQAPDDADEGSSPLKGIEVRSSHLRVYRYPELFSHVLGYLKEIDKTTLEKMQLEHPEIYSSGDFMGAAGVEATYDKDLKGQDGMKARVVDARGRQVKGHADISLIQERESEAAIDGHHLLTTLDFDAQQAAAQALGDRKGSVVALDPSSGEVLVLYSSPGYDGNRVMGNIDHAYWQKINLDPAKYLYNRAIQATYPPGSTYKIVGSFAGLHSHAITPDSHFSCGGGMQFGNRFFQCWNKGGHGSTELVRAIAQSCDVFFYNVGLKVGVDGLHHYAHLLGLGEKTGVDLPFEQSGLIPSSEWKLKRFKQPWIESETLSISIGQGYDLVTPLQNARMIAMIANGGYPLHPHAGKNILDAQKQVVRELSFPVSPSTTGAPSAVVPPEELQWIQKGLIDVVHGAGGTAGRLRASPYKIAGKTGTAQVIGYESKRARSQDTNDHAWFVCYAPYDHPQIAMAVVVENGGHGGAAAAPVALAVIEAYLGKQNPGPSL